MNHKNTLYIFDIDGTLTDSVTKYLISVTKAMIGLGIKDVDTDYDNYKHHTDSYALRYNYERNFKDNYPKHILSDFENSVAAYMLQFGAVKEIKGAKALIQFFKDSEIPFCFATGSLPKPSTLKLDQCDIWYDESLLATSKTHESREGFVMDAIEKAKLFYGRSHFTDIVSVGDGLWDLKTAENLSLDFIGIGNLNKEKLIHAGATRYYDDLEAFKKTFE